MLKQELTTSKEIVEEAEQRYKRECRGRALALTRNVFRIEKTDSFYYCQSENNSNVYYFIRYAPEKLEWCSCPDSSIRGQKCKHLFGIDYAIRLATVKDVDKLPVEVKKREGSKSYTQDDYSF
jgi:predicted nucleic acid-binding Zn finger protein